MYTLRTTHSKQTLEIVIYTDRSPCQRQYPKIIMNQYGLFLIRGSATYDNDAYARYPDNQHSTHSHHSSRHELVTKVDAMT